MAEWIGACTIVDGLTTVGRYAEDGSFNVVEADGLSFVGIQHPSGAYWVTQTSDPDRTKVYAADGSFLILDTVFAAG